MSLSATQVVLSFFPLDQQLPSLSHLFPSFRTSRRRDNKCVLHPDLLTVSPMRDNLITQYMVIAFVVDLGEQVFGDGVC